ncbi:hypothetical protein ACIP9H_33805 [Streptomyces sp. NPDC088732]|uniref:hypothetical protein n=1 Tax=Streptomyces sp. NPDC088732 TaxID=3365879 RepID=UPI00380AF7ED
MTATALATPRPASRAAERPHPRPDRVTGFLNLLWLLGSVATVPLLGLVVLSAQDSPPPYASAPDTALVEA